LKWSFGGKEQHGWAIYVPLVRRTISVSIGPESRDFAIAVAVWQRNHGLEPTGVIDSQTWNALISDFQFRRIKSREYPTADQLIEAPLCLLYDPARAIELRQVERATYAAYLKMLAAALKDKSLGLKRDSHGNLDEGEMFLRLISAFRSRDYQDKLR